MGKYEGLSRNHLKQLFGGASAGEGGFKVTCSLVCPDGTTVSTEDCNGKGGNLATCSTHEDKVTCTYGDGTSKDWKCT